MSEDWKWLEEIEDKAKRTYNELHHPLTGRAFESEGNLAVIEKLKLIACIKEMREALKYYQDPEKCEEYGDTATGRLRELGSVANEALARCKEGNFK